MERGKFAACPPCCPGCARHFAPRPACAAQPHEMGDVKLAHRHGPEVCIPEKLGQQVGACEDPHRSDPFLAGPLAASARGEAPSTQLLRERARGGHGCDKGVCRPADEARDGRTAVAAIAVIASDASMKLSPRATRDEFLERFPTPAKSCTILSPGSTARLALLKARSPRHARPYFQSRTLV